MKDADEREAIRALLAWYRKNKRILPWRDVDDAYRVFISEIMLQQTQVDRVIPKFREWIHQFPTWKRLADAKTADLLHAWAGLGYNRRALQVREAARQVVERGEPKDEGEWRALKGVGPYTAAALTEFANHRPAIVIDTNVRRVAGRLFLGRPHPTLSDDARLRGILARIVPRRGRHWDVPQAFMDLGSAICLPSPQCAVCPLRRRCLAAPKFLSGMGPKRRMVRTKERRHANKPHLSRPHPRTDTNGRTDAHRPHRTIRRRDVR